MVETPETETGVKAWVMKNKLYVAAGVIALFVLLAVAGG